jgi:hypothetical protein
VDWALTTLAGLGFTAAIASAATLLALRGIVFDQDASPVELAIRDALHPASGAREEHLRGLRENSLKRLLKSYFNGLVEDRTAQLLRDRDAGQGTWTDGLITDPKGGILPLLANLILILRHDPVGGRACLRSIRGAVGASETSAVGLRRGGKSRCALDRSS